MICIHNILAPTDFSSDSELALDYAASLSKSFGAKIWVMHAFETPAIERGTETYCYPVPEFFKDLEDKRRAQLEETVELLRSKGVAAAEGLFVCGKPYLEIIRQAKERNFDLIALTTHSESGLSRFVFGSTAERVVRLAPCPVLTIKPHERRSDLPLGREGPGERSVIHG